MSFDREAAKEAGYSDAEIDAYLKAESPEKKKLLAHGEALPAPTGEEKKIDSGAANAATAGLAAGPLAGGAAAAAGAGYAGYKVAQLGNRVLDNMRGPVAPPPAAGGAPVAPVAPAAPSPILNAQGQPMSRAPVAPVAPTAPAPMAKPGGAKSVMDIAMKGISGGAKGIADAVNTGMSALSGSTAARMAGRVMGPAGMALESKSLGPAVPSTGRMRGMEINPLTSRPWTPEQIAQYEANPQMFDSQMAPPQFRR